METPEEKRARRLAKKEAKERRRKEKMGWDKDYLVYIIYHVLLFKKLELISALEQYKCSSHVPNYIYEKLLCCSRGTQIQIILLGMKVF